MSLIEIKNLHLHIKEKHILQGINFVMGVEKVGLVGLSGSGKSLFSKTLVGLLPKKAVVEAEVMNWRGKSLMSQWESVRGKEIGFVLQEAKSALHPFMTIGSQLGEIEGSVEAALDQVSLSSNVRKMYPHQLSGGMGQRVMIAMMLMLKPKLLIADEMLSSLDFDLKETILGLLKEVLSQENMALLYITHDRSEVEGLCDRVIQMRGGKIIEEELCESY